MTPEASPIYDSIGQNYRTHRAADPRIVQHLIDLAGLAPGATVCDVGAGSGNYANALAARRLRVKAVEPSALMRAQADPSPLVSWHDGVAERLPLPDACADAVMCVLAVHHFGDYAAALREMARVCARGPLIFFTHDPRAGESMWFNDYFADILSAGLAIFPPLAEIARAETGRHSEIHAFALPADLKDRFMHAAWNDPDAYFDATFRANNSGFAKADPAHVAAGLARLKKDLDSGAWDRRHGHLRTRASFDAGYRFMVLRA